MEGESTLGVLSGFVLGALTFHHLNTDSDTVSRARLPTPPSLPAVPARPAGSRTRAPSPALIRALFMCSRLGVEESSRGPPAREESRQLSCLTTLWCEGSRLRFLPAARVRR